MAVTWATVRKLAMALEGVEESTSYGTPAFKVRGKLFLRQQEDPDTLVVRTDLEQRDDLLAADPKVYYLTDHYVAYPWVLVRMSRVHPDALRDLVGLAHKLAKPKVKPGARRRKSS